MLWWTLTSHSSHGGIWPETDSHCCTSPGSKRKMPSSSPTGFIGSYASKLKILTIVEWSPWFRFLPSYSFQVVGRIRDTKYQQMLLLSSFLLFRPLSSLIKEHIYDEERCWEVERGGKMGVVFWDLEGHSVSRQHSQPPEVAMCVKSQDTWGSPTGDKRPWRPSTPNLMVIDKLSYQSPSFCHPPVTHDIEIWLFWCGDNLSWRHFNNDYQNHNISNKCIVPGTW